MSSIDIGLGAEMKISNDQDSVTRAFEYAEKFFATENDGFDSNEDVLFNTNIVLDEIISNIRKYSGSYGDIEVSLSISGKSIKIVISDDGIPFDPTATQSERQAVKGIEECQVGGVGLKIVNQLSKKMEYSRVGDKNKLTIWLPIM